MPGTEFIRVTARVRPSASAVPQERVVEVVDKKNICFNPRNPRGFTFDAVFDENVTQEQVFDELGSRIVDGCVDGFNGTIFAYGQTGSGKTHTMLGPSQVENFLLSSEHRGLIPRACDALFTKLCTRAAEKKENFKYDVTCKFVELYNEEFYDLLSTSQQKLTIRSDSNGVQLIGVSEHTVHSGVDMMRILELGWEARRTAETAMNRESSRSHAIFIVDIKTEELINTIVNKKSATLNLVDLAGSERQTQAQTVGDRFKEAININLSLSVLGRVIRTLSAPSRRREHVPYRESKLTHILRDSLGGNSRTAVIVNVHPDAGYYSDTLTTLQFSAACRKIENRVHVNEDLSGDTVMAYKSEIARLRTALETVEEKIRAEMTSKLTLVEDDLKKWKEMAMSREKILVEARLQRDLIAAQLTRIKPSGEGDVKSYDDEIRDILSQYAARIDSVRTFEDLSVVQLENDLSSATQELDQMRARCESAEASCKSLTEKYQSLLEGYDEALVSSPLRRLNVTTPGRPGPAKTPAQRKKRRETMFTPGGRSHPERKSVGFRPVLFNDSVDEEQENIEQDIDMLEERELLRLQMDNNSLTQLLSEKEAAIEEIYEAQKAQAKQWIEEREKYLEAEAAMKSQVDKLTSERLLLQESLDKAKQRTELLSAKISSFNDENCGLRNEIDELQADKFDLEDRLQTIQNEYEQLCAEQRDVSELDRTIAKLQNQLDVAQRNNADLESQLQTNENTRAELETSLRVSDRRRKQLELELHKAIEDGNDIEGQYSDAQIKNAELLSQLTSATKEVERLTEHLEAQLQANQKTAAEMQTLLRVSNEKKTELEAQLHRAQEDNHKLQEHHYRAQNDNADLLSQLKAATEESEKVRVNLVAADGCIVKLEDQIASLQMKCQDLELKYNSQMESFSAKSAEANMANIALQKVLAEKEGLYHENDQLKRSYEQLQQRSANREQEFAEELDKLKRRRSEELNNADKMLELERNAHEKTKQQFIAFQETTQQTFDQKLAELRDSFSNKERRLTTDMTDRQEQIMRLEAEKETLLDKCNRLQASLRLAEQCQTELEATKRELEVLRSAKEEDDRAIADLVGHHNHRQKLSYLEKIREENYNLKKQVADMEIELRRCRGAAGRTNAAAGPATRSRSARAAQ